MKVLFIGGTGRLSKDVAKLSSDMGYDVYLLTRGSQNRSLFVDERYHMLYGDIRDSEHAIELLKDFYFDVVIDFLTYNVDQLHNTLSVLTGKFKQYIFISTATVYKRTNYDELITEANTKTGNDKWAYAYNKYLCEEEIKRFFKDKSETYTIIRPGVTYGNTRIPYPIVPADTRKEYSLLYRIINHQPIPVFDNGNTETTITHTKDFAKGVVGLMGNEKAYANAFHITTDEVVTWGDVLNCLEKVINLKINKLYVEQKDIYKEIPYYRSVLIGDKGNRTRFDNKKICSVVPGLSFDIPLIKGIEETVFFYKDHPELQIVDYYWMGCLDRLAMKHGYSVKKPNFNNVSDIVAYCRGRYTVLDYSFKILKKVEKKLKLH